MKIVKSPDNLGGYVYLLPNEQKVTKKPGVASGAKFLSDGFVSIDFSGNLVVIKTKPAFAGSIASAIDEASPYEILGTIAGDDTILLVMREGVENKDVIDFLEKIMPNIKGKLI